VTKGNANGKQQFVFGAVSSVGGNAEAWVSTLQIQIKQEIKKEAEGDCYGFDTGKAHE
jgi:hypothetical protein